jgi:hypothetical protein
MASSVTIYQVGENWNWEVYVDGVSDNEAYKDFVHGRRSTTITRDNAFEVTLVAVGANSTYRIKVADNENKTVHLKFKSWGLKFVEC